MNMAANGAAGPAPRTDHLAIAEFVAPGSRVLDVGCGDGQLLKLLETRLGPAHLDTHHFDSHRHTSSRTLSTSTATSLGMLFMER